MTNNSPKELDFKNRVLELTAILLKNHEPKTAINKAIKTIASQIKADEEVVKRVVLNVMLEGLPSAAKKYGYI